MTEHTPSVLIVDDDPDMLDLVGEALGRKGFRVVQAHDGEEALARAGEALPDLILLDMRMPVLDGWGFARMFRERYGRRVPIVVMTAAEDSKLRADEIGANADLGKPFELARLYEVVEDTLGVP